MAVRAKLAAGCERDHGAHHDLGILELQDVDGQARYGAGDRHSVMAGSGLVLVTIGRKDLGLYHAIEPAKARRLGEALIRIAGLAEAQVPAGTVLQ